MTGLTITYTVYRDDDATAIEVEATRGRYGFTISPPIELTERENQQIDELLDEAEAEDWDENKWQSEREHAS